MSVLASHLIPVICGPTAGGKSELAVRLAIALRDRHQTSAEIITADAFQVYAGLDIGTAKPTIDERRGVVHHLIDIVAAPSVTDDASADNTPFTVDDWLTHAQRAIADCQRRQVLPIVVGGTHLYIKALVDGLFDGPEPDEALRASLNAMDPALRRAELERVDPAAAARIHPNDVRRSVRALEVFRLTGVPISAHQTQWHDARADGARRSPYLLVALDWEVEHLNRRINARVKDMMQRGLLDEVRALVKSNGFTRQSAEALGYKQLIPVARAGCGEDAAVEQIKIETRRFAKNQRTWLRRLGTTPGALRIAAPDADGRVDVDRWVDLVLSRLTANQG